MAVDGGAISVLAPSGDNNCVTVCQITQPPAFQSMQKMQDKVKEGAPRVVQSIPQLRWGSRVVSCSPGSAANLIDG